MNRWASCSWACFERTAKELLAPQELAVDGLATKRPPILRSVQPVRQSLLRRTCRISGPDAASLEALSRPSLCSGGHVQESGALAACNASYRAVFPTLIRAAASRTFRPLAICSLARCSFSGVTTGLRPPLRPRAAAAANRALVRSRMRSRSNWPKAPNTERSAAHPMWWCRCFRTATGV